MTDRPSFIMTKGQRKKADRLLDDTRIIDHYRQAAGGLYEWDGLPEGCPRDFIESTALFFAPGLGAKKTKAYGKVLLPINVSIMGIYGKPYEWIASPLNGLMPTTDSDLFTPSTDPCLWIGSSTEERIRPYVQLMVRTLKVLDQNILGLSQPVMINGVPGSTLEGLVIESELMDGELTIPTTGAGLSPEILDLKAQDHTQNLISTIDWCDARILEIMASSNGVEKSSGITTMETVSGVQSVMQQFDIGLQMREEWCEQINRKLKMDLSVRPGKGISMLTQEQPTEESQEVEDAND